MTADCRLPTVDCYRQTWRPRPTENNPTTAATFIITNVKATRATLTTP
jgi:hypothetical protein